MKKMKLTTLLLLFVFTATLLMGCGNSANSGNTATGTQAATTSDSGNYILATGGTSGTYYSFGGAMAQIINKAAGTNITAQSTGASKENIRLVSSKEAELAIVQNDVLDYASKGIELFDGEKIENVLTIGTLYPEVVQLVVAADSDIKTVADLKGKKVSVGDAGSGVEANAKQVLEAYGLTFDDIDVRRLSFKESGDAFSNKQLDAFFVTAGVPNTAIVELSVKNPVRLLNIDGEQMKALQAKYPFYTEATIPKDVYKTSEDIKTIAIQATLVCSAELSEEAVYNITKAIFENLGELGTAHAKGKEVSLEKTVQGVSVPFHPGAEKYYKEKGVLK